MWEPTDHQIRAALEVLDRHGAGLADLQLDPPSVANELLTAAHEARHRLSRDPEGIEIASHHDDESSAALNVRVVTAEGQAIVVGFRVDAAGVSITWGPEVSTSRMSMVQPPAFTGAWRFPAPVIVVEEVTDA